MVVDTEVVDMEEGEVEVEDMVVEVTEAMDGADENEPKRSKLLL